MNPHHTTHRSFVLALGITSVLFASGCSYLADVYYQGDYESKERQVEKLEKEYEALQKKYDKRLAYLMKDKEERKDNINKLLKEKKIAKSLAAIFGLKLRYGRLKSKEYGKLKDDNIRIKEGIEEGEFVDASLKRVVEIVDERIKAQEFKALDQELAEAKRYYKVDKEVAKQLTQRHNNLNQIWLKLVVDETQRVMKTHRAASVIYGLQAIEIAQKIGDKRTERKLKGILKGIKDKVTAEHAFRFTMGSASGPHAQKMSSSITRGSWGDRAIAFSPQRTSKTSGVLSFSTSEPSFRPSQSQSQKSFRYKSGTKSIPNPKLGSVKDRIRSLESDAQSAKSSMEGHMKAASKPCSGEGSQLKSCNYSREQRRKSADQERRRMKEKLSEVSSQKSKLSSMPKTISKDVFSDYSYTVTTYTMSGSMPLQAQLQMKGGRPLTLRKNASASKSDSAHDAHRKNGEGVSKDPANPPTEAAVLPSVVSSASSALSSHVISGFKRHRDALYSSLKKTTKEDKLNAFAIFIMLAPNDVPKDYISQVEQLSKVSNVNRKFSGL